VCVCDCKPDVGDCVGCGEVGRVECEKWLGAGIKCVTARLQAEVGCGCVGWSPHARSPENPEGVVSGRSVCVCVCV